MQIFSDNAANQWAIATTLIAGFLLCTALVLEHAQGLAPCPLCMMQRLWIAVTGILAWVSLVHNPKWGIYPLFTGLAAAVGGGFSVYQLRLQSLPADQVPACGPDLQYMLDEFPLSEILIAMTSGTGDCAKVVWTFLGLSIPAWSLVGFIALFACAVMQFRKAGVAN